MKHEGGRCLGIALLPTAAIRVITDLSPTPRQGPTAATSSATAWTWPLEEVPWAKGHLRSDNLICRQK